MKVLVVAGGTGGHFYPGLAVAKEFLAQGDTVHFVIRKGDFVQPLLEREKIPFSCIWAAGFRRSLHPSLFTAPFKLVMGFIQSLFCMAQIRPDLAVVMGGYLSVPPALAAWFWGVPFLLHEQNALPGWANRFLSLVAKKVAVSFPGSEAVFGSKAVLTGNPIRSGFFSLPSRTEALQTFHLETSKKTILVFGGSMGAKAINQAVLDVLKVHQSFSDFFQVLHFTGVQNEAAVRAQYEGLVYLNFVAGYCHDMSVAYAASDFVICRAGASTVTELIALKKPALLIPYPTATGDHQTKNAEVLTRAQAGVLCPEGPKLKEGITAVLEEIMHRPEVLDGWKTAYQDIPIQPAQAAQKITKLGKSLVRSNASSI